MSEKFFLTTPIYYVNARPHIGHAYTTIVADVLARRARAQGKDTFFLTGTDEHGQKIERSAAAAGIPPQAFTDEVSAAFQSLWDRMGLTYDKFIRTTSPEHKRGVQKLFQTLVDRGEIYLSSYTGSYCVSDEAFVDLPAGTPCPDCGRPLETVTEENYFFKLSAYQEKLLNLIESGDTGNGLLIQPESRRNEVLSFLRGNVAAITQECEPAVSGLDTNQAHDHYQAMVYLAVERGKLARSSGGNLYVPGGLNDLSISRTSFKWGIPVPGNENHVIYVWLDALANYMTALGFGSEDPADIARFEKYWPADLHIVGKEIIRFHCVYWPAFLMAAGLPLPKQVVAHGWLLFEESKMSKSKGNIVRTETILDAFGPLCPAPPLSPSSLSSFGAAGGSASPALRDDARKGTPSSPENTASGEPRKGAPSGVPQAAPSLKGTGFSPSTSGENDAAALAAEGMPLSPTKHQQDLFAADVLRYFLLREIPFGQDGSFSFDALITRYNADLANGYGNLVSRTLKMIDQYFAGTIPSPKQVRTTTVSGFDDDLHLTPAEPIDGNALLYLGHYARNTVAQVGNAFTAIHPQRVLSEIWDAIATRDEIITSTTPWKLAKSVEQRDLLEGLLYEAAESIRIITALLYPILPYATASVWRQLGLGDIEEAARNGELNNLTWGGLKPGTKLGSLAPIFPRADKGLAQIMTDLESPKPLSAITEAHDATHSATDDLPVALIASAPPQHDPAAGPRTTTFAEPNPGSLVAASAALTTGPTDPAPTTNNQLPITNNQITIDDFAKVDLRVAQILVCERIPKADKLLRLEVDLGYEKRQILSGIAEWYTPEELIGRRIVVIVNLAPRKMRGLESHGMLLAASSEGGKPFLATFADADTLPLGARLK